MTIASRRRRGHTPVRTRLAALVAVSASALTCLVVAVPASASASCATTCTWTGQTPGGGQPPSAGSTHWSNASDWDGNGVPAGTVATPDTALVFPDLSGYPTCASSPPTSACYDSNNDLSGIATDSFQLDNAKPYAISGSGISIGSGGITAGSADTSYYGNPVVDLPLTLTASQPWSFSTDNSNGYFEPSTVLQGDITGLTSNVTMSMDDASLDLYNASSALDDEVGTVTVSAPSNDFGDVGLGLPGHGASLNRTDGNAVSFTGGVSLDVGGASSTGPLSMSGGTVLLGNANNAATLNVNGGATLDPSSGLNTRILDTSSSPVAGADYSQLGTTGNTDLGGSSLTINAGTSDYTDTCLALPLGTVYTLVTAGALSGTFSNAPSSGDEIQAFCNGGISTPATFQINYTGNSVTATVVNPTTATTTTLSASPSSPDTNQNVTLTAEVSPTPSSPSGTVDFTDNGNQISGCTAQPVDASTGDATCQTSFPAGTQNLNATYNPAGGSSYSGSSGSDTVTVGKDPSTTTLSASRTSPSAGQDVTYTATVTPADSGYAKPSGTVEFDDGGSPISGCTSQPLTASSTSSSATCTTRYGSAGSHSISARYGGDANFNGSASSTQTVTVSTPSSNPSPSPNAKPKPPRWSTLSLSVDPGRVRAGVRACFEFTARAGGHGVSGVFIRFAGHSARTAWNGRARICIALRSGTYRPTASKGKFKNGRATVTVPASTPPRFTG